ncbi:MAG TPA: HAMP domain-containing sensor histidine kinase [Jatrophihabitantaceae bacterium]|nr:HAMP domain-containing sensor histidine kinase [Jatrophihabitantaceae bacterium]
MRRRILLLVTGITVLVVLAFAIPVAFLVRSTVEQRSERSIRDEAAAIAHFLNAGAPTDASIATYLAGLTQTADRCASVQTPDGTLLGKAAPQGGGIQPFVAPSGLPSGADDNRPNGPAGGPGYDAAQVHPVPGGKAAELSVKASEDGMYRIQVFASNSALHSGESGWYALLAGGSIGLLLIGVVGGELVTRRIVRPLTHTAQTAHQISAGDTTARAPTDGPREVAEVGTALNRLADRIDELIAEERETAADLSHRMRTPLTALRLDAEALRSPDEATRIGGHVTALERTLTAVIHAARRPQREGRMPSTDATAVVASRIAYWSALTDEQERSRSVRLPDGPLFVRASSEDLAAAVDALVENVIAHTPEGTPFTVSLSTVDGGASASLVVSDSGPGLPDGAGVRGRSDRGSSGLGLDIARRCAEASGGAMYVGHSPSGGAAITLELRAP